MAPRSGKALYKSNPFQVLSADFCHTTDHGAPNGVLGSVYGHDANNALVDLGEYPESDCFFKIEIIHLSQCAVHVRAFANESVLQWKKMFRALVNVVPEVEKDGATVFMDAAAFKGCEQILEAYNANVNRIICVKHRAEVIKKNLGAEDAKTALAAIYAKRPRALEKAKSKFSSRTKQYMAKTPDEEQYPCLHANIGHHTTSQGAESGNKSNLVFRK